MTSRDPVERVPQERGLGKGLCQYRGSADVVCLHPGGVASVEGANVLFLRVTSVKCPLVEVPFRPMSCFVDVVIVGQVTRYGARYVGLVFSLSSQLRSRYFPFVARFLDGLRL